MRVTIDKAGRMVVPKKLRTRLALEEGGEVEVTERDGVIELVPVAAEVDLVPGEGGPVAQPRETLPPLTDDVVRDTLEHLRR
jgi:AbrB family looped-hinge helix DNA binding protein